MNRPLSEEFLPEAEELLEHMEADLQELGRGGQPPERVADRLNALFRSAHSLKGMAGMAGLTEITQLSHELEELMDHLRMGRLSLDGALSDLIGDGIALLRRLVAAVAHPESSTTPVDLAGYTSLVKQSLAKPTREEGVSLEALGIPPALTVALTTYEEHRLRENLRLGRTLYAIRLRFGLDNFDQELGRVSSRVQEIGELITTVPRMTASDESDAAGGTDSGTIGFDLIVGSDRPLADVTERAGPSALKTTLLCSGPSSHTAVRTAQPGDAAPSVAPHAEPVASLRSLSDTVRVEIRHLDHLLNVMGELVLQKSVLHQLAKEFLERDGSTGLAGGLLKTVQIIEHRLSELQEGLVEARMVPLTQLFDRLVRAAGKLSRELGKEVDLRMSGEETRLDKTMVEAIADPLLHLIRNAMDHGLETPMERQAAGKPAAGQITLRAKPQGNGVVIEIADDGRGIDLARVRETAVRKGLADPAKSYDEASLISFLFQPGFSTSEQVSEVSGRGVGLDVVAKNIAAFNGLVDVATQPGKGTTFTITLPITLVIVRALVVQVGADLFAVPLSSVTETLLIGPTHIRTIDGAEAMELRNRTLPLLRLAEHFACAPLSSNPDELYVVVVGLAENRLGLVVDAIEGQQEIVIKSVGELLKGMTAGIAGATELGNRRMILVLDIPALLDEAARLAMPSGR